MSGLIGFLNWTACQDCKNNDKKNGGCQTATDFKDMIEVYGNTVRCSGYSKEVLE